LNTIIYYISNRVYDIIVQIYIYQITYSIKSYYIRSYHIILKQIILNISYDHIFYNLQLFYYIICFTHFLSSLRFNLDTLFDIHTSNLIYLIYCTSPIKSIKSNKIYQNHLSINHLCIYLPIYLPSCPNHGIPVLSAKNICQA
jgi:hypothetical protein